MQSQNVVSLGVLYKPNGGLKWTVQYTQIHCIALYSPLKGTQCIIGLLHTREPGGSMQNVVSLGVVYKLFGLCRGLCKPPKGLYRAITGQYRALMGYMGL